MRWTNNRIIFSCNVSSMFFLFVFVLFFSPFTFFSWPSFSCSQILLNWKRWRRCKPRCLLTAGERLWKPKQQKWKKQNKSRFALSRDAAITAHHQNSHSHTKKQFVAECIACTRCSNSDTTEYFIYFITHDQDTSLDWTSNAVPRASDAADHV